MWQQTTYNKNWRGRDVWELFRIMNGWWGGDKTPSKYKTGWDWKWDHLDWILTADRWGRQADWKITEGKWRMAQKIQKHARSKLDRKSNRTQRKNKSTYTKRYPSDTNIKKDILVSSKSSPDEDQVMCLSASLQGVEHFVSVCHKYTDLTRQRPPTLRWKDLSLPLIIPNVCSLRSTRSKVAICVNSNPNFN